MNDRIINNTKSTPDVLRVQGIMSMGFGIIPNAVMLDRRLTLEAKAIYAYFCSHQGEDSAASPSRDKILHDLQMGEARYYRHFNLLKEFGYISVEQNINSTGKFENNIYTINK